MGAYGPQETVDAIFLESAISQKDYELMTDTRKVAEDTLLVVSLTGSRAPSNDDGAALRLCWNVADAM